MTIRQGHNNNDNDDDDDIVILVALYSLYVMCQKSLNFIVVTSKKNKSLHRLIWATLYIQRRPRHA